VRIFSSWVLYRFASSLVDPVGPYGTLDEGEAGGAATGIVGGDATELGGRMTGIVGTSAAELTPRLPISTEPSGIPARGAPPGVVGDVGFEDAARLFEPEPHVPDIPAVSIVPDADMAELCVMPEVVENPKVAEVPVDMPGDAAVPPAVPPVAGIEFATDMPPPS
jgi:hypothetical protein